MRIALGIDTGGTYTDAVLVDHDSGSVIAGTKALTTHHDLSIGIREAISALVQQGAADAESRLWDQLPEGDLRGESAPASRSGTALVAPSEIGMVGLSTTLATNAIVEGRGSPVCLILIGYDRSLIEQHGFRRDLVTDDVVYLRGGHDLEGSPLAPLDEAGLQAAVQERMGRVEAFAISGYCGVRNPEHELRARELVRQLTAAWPGQAERPLPVTCGHELTTRLHSVRRATTAALNARLIPLLEHLVDTVYQVLDEMGITAPLMVVKGDGSLVRASWAMQRPIETILSGPAGSVVGTWHLAGREDVWVVDVGGTTTDIAVLRGGQPRLNPEGARVGGWRTMVEAVDVHTVGLGGDSHVRLAGSMMGGSTVTSLDGLAVGPRRVVPLCLLGSRYPEAVEELRRQLDARDRMRLSGQFALAEQSVRAAASAGGAGDNSEAVLERLADGPRSLIWMAENLPYGPLAVRQLDDLVARQLVRLSAFTPTDALHVLGRFVRWDVEAARLGASLLAAQAGLDVRTFCERVVAEMSSRVSAELVTKALGGNGSEPRWEEEPSARTLLALATGQVPTTDLACQLSLRRPVVAVGAPVEAYLPRSAEQLGTELVIPPHAEVANAVGAVAGSVVQRLHALIRPAGAQPVYRLHLGETVRDFDRLEEAVAYVQREAPAMVTEMAHKAGAEQVEIQCARFDRAVPLDVEWGQEVYLETDLVVSAVGRPAFAASR
jgi:N-methylhydantoinase A/oxoprolinase/acetone carboxylase beta subunit